MPLAELTHSHRLSSCWIPSQCSRVRGGIVLAEIAHIGVLLLLFTVGLKLRLKNIFRPEVWGTGLMQIVVTCLLFVPIMIYLLGLTWPVALAMTIAFSFSSTVVAAKVLEEKRELVAFHGRVAIGILIIQDIIAVALLSIFGQHTPSIWGLCLFALPLLRPVLHRLADFSGHDELLVLFGLMLAVFAGGLGFESLGLSPELGAIVFGSLLADHAKAKELAGVLWGLKEVMLAGFFLEIGMAGIPTLETLGAALLLTLVLPLKGALFFFLLLAFRLRARSAFLAGLSLASFSEFGLIVAQLMTRQGLLSTDWLVMLAVTVALSFLFASSFYRLAHRLYEWLESRLIKFETHRRHPDDEPISLGNAHFLVMGMGKVGTGAYAFLSHRGERVAGLDSDPAKVEQHRHDGRRVLYADAEDPGLWQHLALAGIRAVLLAMPDPEANRIGAEQLRKHGYQGLICATSRFEDDAKATQMAGADLTLNIFHEAGVGFAENVWEAVYPEKLTSSLGSNVDQE